MGSSTDPRTASSSSEAFGVDLFALPPEEAPTLEECGFYHSIELPGLGLQHGQWDLRPGIDEYLGKTDFRGLRVLEIGPANGFVTFELERRGATVVAVDLPETAVYDPRPSAVPAHGQGDGVRRIANAFWLGHALTASSARVVHAHVNELPEGLGSFDVAVIANVLQHLRDPLGAVMSVAQHAAAIVVTETDWMHGLHENAPCMVLFEGAHPYSWFQLKPPLVTSILAELGYVEQEVTRHEQLFLESIDYSSGAPNRVATGNLVPHFTVTARREAASSTAR
jgi:SAM-dependent methyltransferase